MSLRLTTIDFFVLGRGKVADRLEEVMVVEPPDPLEGGEFAVFEAPPRPAGIDEFGLVESDDRLGQSVVVGVTAATDRRLDPGHHQTLGVPNRQILNAAV